jgi:hypothetical protein
VGRAVEHDAQHGHRRRRVAQGDLEGGFRQMLPLGLSSMVKAYQMTDQGFTDSKGNVLPMEPSARDILAQAVGFNPAQNAEYNEARSDQMQRQGILARQAGRCATRSSTRWWTATTTPRAADRAGHGLRRANPAFGVLRGVEGSIRAAGRRRRCPSAWTSRSVSARRTPSAAAHTIRGR